MATLSKRVPKEIAAVQTMRAAGIYYWSHESDMRKGKALIIGPEDTPYAFCPLLFDIVLPDDYPFSPPKVTFVTSDGVTRFHPNLYIEGKVCLSILGTWNGPAWTSVMNLRTVLLSIMGLLDNEPILHEPGYTSYKGTQKSRDYSSFIEHSCIRYIVNTIEQFSKGQMDPHLEQFKEQWIQALPTIYKNTMMRLTVLAAEPIRIWGSVVYNMSGTSHYSEMLEKLLSIGGTMKFM